MYGTNPIAKVEHIADGSLLVHSVFLTLQGECIYTGWPAVFLRLARCTLACSWCDTEFESGAERYTVDSLMDRIIDTARGSKAELCVITGGEPMRQNVVPLVRELIRTGWLVQIETAGIHWVEGLPPDVTIVCSPKTPKLNPTLQMRADHFKYIIDAREEMDERNGLPRYAVSMGGMPNKNPLWHPHPSLHHSVYLQPLDSPDAGYDWGKSTALCVKNALRHGYKVSLQTHKLLKID